jgi:hypothetical protein
MVEEPVMEIREWEEARTGGMLRYIIWRGIAPSLIVALLISCVRVFGDSGYSFSNLDFSWFPFYLIVSGLLCSILGALFARADWKKNEREYQSLNE